MLNIMEINGYRAVITYDPKVEMFRGDFMGLKGRTDFYAKDIDTLKKEGASALRIFLDRCAESGVKPKKDYSGRFNVRVSSSLHADIAIIAAAQGKSLNQWVSDTLEQAVQNG
jgi:predicted HicB family RNase H-like nuclease